MDQQQPDYSFIMQGGNRNRPQIFAPKTQKQRIILVGFIAGSVMLLGLTILIIINILSVDISKKITDLAILQTEIQRTMEIGVKDSRDSSTKALAQTASSTLASHAHNTVALAAKKNIKISPKQLLTGKQPKTDERLETAKNLGRFDEEFRAIYIDQLNQYTRQINDLLSSVNDRETRTLFTGYLDNNSILSLSYEAKSSD